jgi:hypothetical protein
VNGFHYVSPTVSTLIAPALHGDCSRLKQTLLLNGTQNKGRLNIRIGPNLCVVEVSGFARQFADLAHFLLSTEVLLTMLSLMTLTDACIIIPNTRWRRWLVFGGLTA